MEKTFYKLVVQPITNESVISLLISSVINNFIPYSVLVKYNLANRVVKSQKTLFLECENEQENEEPPPNCYPITFSKENIHYDENSKSFYSDYDGIPVFNKGEFEFYKVEYNAHLEIKVTDENYKAFLTVYPQKAGYKSITTKDIYDEIEYKGITTGIEKLKIDTIAEKIKPESSPVENILIAKGIRKIDGVDAKVEFFVEPKKNLKPQITEDGRIDFYNLDIIETVEKDKELARFYPHKPEQNGKDVFGNIVHAKQAKRMLFPGGRNTYTREDDPNLILARSSGSVLIKDDKISVEDIFVIPNNIDFSTGNVKFKGALKIKGDVLNDFTVESGANIDIGGSVENAKIYSGGAVNIKHGFTGNGEGIIKAEGDVILRYISQQSVYSRSSITVQNEAANAKLYAKNNITVGGRTLSIYGGYAIASNNITANNLGSEYGVKTIVEVGYDYQWEEIIKENESKVAELENVILQFNNEIDKYSRLGRLTFNQRNTLNILLEQSINYRLLFEKMQDTANELGRIQEAITKVLALAKLDSNSSIKFSDAIGNYIAKKFLHEKFSEEIKVLKEKITTPTKSIIEVKNYIYPGVTLKINKVNLHIKETIRGKKFYLSKDGTINGM